MILLIVHTLLVVRRLFFLSLISGCGRLTLVKPVLGSLPLFYFYIFLRLRLPFLVLSRSFAEDFFGEVMKKKLKSVGWRGIRFLLPKTHVVLE